MAVRICNLHFTAGHHFRAAEDFVPAITKIQQMRDETDFCIKAVNGPANDYVNILFVQFEVTIGAMNVPPRTAKFDLSKWEMFEIMAKAALDE